MATTITNPFLKTLAISLTTPSLQKPTSLFIPKSLFFTKPTKQFTLSLQKPTISAPIFVAQTSDLEQESSNNAVLDEEEKTGINWGLSVDVSESEAFGFKPEDTFPQISEDVQVYVGNLPYDVDSEQLASIFEGAGVVEMAEVIHDRDSDRSKGFGFVTMSTVEEAEKALEMFRNYEINGRSLVVNKAMPRGSRPEGIERPPREIEPSFKVYVGNLPWDVDNDRLEQLFSGHGKVLNAHVVQNRETGRSRGFGFVTMASETEINDAVAALDGQSLDGRTIKVSVAENRPPKRF